MLESKADRLDQLSVIFDVIGTPGESDIQTISNVSTQDYLRSLPVKTPKVRYCNMMLHNREHIFSADKYIYIYYYTFSYLFS